MRQRTNPRAGSSPALASHATCNATAGLFYSALGSFVIGHPIARRFSAFLTFTSQTEEDMQAVGATSSS